MCILFERNKDSSHPLVHFPNAYSGRAGPGQSWELDVKVCFVSGRNLITLAIDAASQGLRDQEARIEIRTRIQVQVELVF